jgi:Formyl transferase
MKILCFTANALRHHALVAQLSTVGDVDVVREVILAGEPAWQYLCRPPMGPAMTEYYRRMDQAEQTVFGEVPYAGHLLWACNLGEASRWQGDPEPYDAIVTYGCSWLRPPLVDRLIAKGAINLHAGMAPQYRGTATNFWCVYDGHPELVGYTIHRLSAGLDNGPILRQGIHFPSILSTDPFLRGMLAVQRGFEALRTELLEPSPPQPQAAHELIRYSRAADFTEAVCAEYLERLREPV